MFIEVISFSVTVRPVSSNISLNNPEIIFFIGWSWIIDDHLIKSNKCICLHPSPLPKYRGGSPIQHQIINGESLSAVTFFEMTNDLDAGDMDAHIALMELEKLNGNSDISMEFGVTPDVGMSKLISSLNKQKRAINYT